MLLQLCTDVDVVNVGMKHFSGLRFISVVCTDFHFWGVYGCTPYILSLSPVQGSLVSHLAAPPPPIISKQKHKKKHKNNLFLRP